MGRLYRFLITVLRPIFWLFFPTKVVGRKLHTGKRGFTICNHLSAIDPVVLAVKLFKREYHVLSKAELYSEKHKVFGWLLKKLGAIPVSRGENDMTAFRTILSLLNEGKNVCFFPEGTRNKEQKTFLLPLKKGVATFALKTKAEIFPVILHKKPRVFRRNILFVGKPFTLEQFYADRAPDVFERATAYVAEKLVELKEKSLRYLEDKRSVEEWL